MFNKKNRKEAVNSLERKVEEYNKSTKELTKKSESLYLVRQQLKLTLSDVEFFINSLSNKPKTLSAEAQQIKFDLKNYQEMLNVMNEEIKKSNLTGTGSVAAGTVAGMGVAAFGPTVAMGIATTFGTASTGTAISALTGAAASKAALAWLGGGALVAGGKGIAGGTALLGLAGPVGWAIGGTALVGSGLLMNGKNKKVIAQANKDQLELDTKKKVHYTYINEIRKLTILTEDTQANLLDRLSDAKENYPKDYKKMNENQKYELGALVNISLAAIEQLSKTVGT
ncbi:hypothetical protein GCM10008929_17840 [Alkalibacterium psychrotolerans]